MEERLKVSRASFPSSFSSIFFFSLFFSLPSFCFLPPLSLSLTIVLFLSLHEQVGFTFAHEFNEIYP